MNQSHDKQLNRPPLIVGIDWADCKHDLTILDGPHTQHHQVDADPHAVEEVIAQLKTRAGERKIAVCLEKGRVRIIYHLMQRDDFVLYLPKLQPICLECRLGKLEHGSTGPR